MPLIEGVTTDDLYSLLEGLGCDVKSIQKARLSIEELGTLYLHLLDKKLVMLAASEKKSWQCLAIDL